MTHSTTPVHEATYRALREQILFGGLKPGKAVTLRGLAERLAVSPTPVREAVRRLIAENALEMHDNRRVSIPVMTQGRYHEIRTARALLEPQLAAQALPNISNDALAQLKQIDDATDACLDNGNIEGYMRGNHEFHFLIYHFANSQVLHGLVSSLWLQFGPFMRQVYVRFGKEPQVDQHKAALQAISENNLQDLRTAILEDIHQGMAFIAAEALA